MLNAIRQLPDDPNYVDANYYFGFVSFSEKNYADALTAFKVAEVAPGYEKVVPYYIANIYLLQNQKDKAVEYAEAKLKKGNQYYEKWKYNSLATAQYEKQDFPNRCLISNNM